MGEELVWSLKLRPPTTSVTKYHLPGALRPFSVLHGVIFITHVSFQNGVLSTVRQLCNKQLDWYKMFMPESPG